MSEPTTKAGRRLVKWSREGQVPWDVTLETVLAIEAEMEARASQPLTLDVERALEQERDKSFASEEAAKSEGHWDTAARLHVRAVTFMEALAIVRGPKP